MERWPPPPARSPCCSRSTPGTARSPGRLGPRPPRGRTSHPCRGRGLGAGAGTRRGRYPPPRGRTIHRRGRPAGGARGQRTGRGTVGASRGGRRRARELRLQHTKARPREPRESGRRPEGRAPPGHRSWLRAGRAPGARGAARGPGTAGELRCAAKLGRRRRQRRRLAPLLLPGRTEPRSRGDKGPGPSPAAPPPAAAGPLPAPLPLRPSHRGQLARRPPRRCAPPPTASGLAPRPAPRAAPATARSSPGLSPSHPFPPRSSLSPRPHRSPRSRASLGLPAAASTVPPRVPLFSRATLASLGPSIPKPSTSHPALSSAPTTSSQFLLVGDLFPNPSTLLTLLLGYPRYRLSPETNLCRWLLVDRSRNPMYTCGLYQRGVRA